MTSPALSTNTASKLVLSESELAFARWQAEQARPKPLQSMVASAQRVTRRSLKGSTIHRSKFSEADSEWQAEAWNMYDLVGEQRFIVNTLADRLSKARLFVGKIDPERPEEDPQPVEDSAINDVLQSFGRTSAGREQILHRLSVNLQIPGEAWIVGVPTDKLDDDTDLPDDITLEGDELDLEWFVMSSDEVHIIDEDRVKLDLPTHQFAKEFSIDDVDLIRVWKPHPRWWKRADSAAKANLPILKELVGLTMHVSAQVQSRLAGAGVLVVPHSAQRAFQASAKLDPDNDADAFTEALIDAMATPLEDRSNASAVVPLVVTVPDESVGKFQYIKFSGELDSQAKELRDESIRRLALGQDAPPEILLGTASANHWGAWLVREDVVSSHLEPPLSRICDALTTQYLWPKLEEVLGMGREQARQYVIWYDVGHLSVQPNANQTAMELHERGVIGDSRLLDLLGVDGDDLTEALKEPHVAQAWQLVNQHPALLLNPGLPYIINELGKVLGKDDDGSEPFNHPVPGNLRRSGSSGTQLPAGGLPAEVGAPDTATDPDPAPPEG